MLGRRRREELVCREVVELISDHIEGALTRSQRRRLEAHLAGCPHCSEYLRQMQATIELTGSLALAEVPPRLREDLLALYRRWRAQGAS